MEAWWSELSFGALLWGGLAFAAVLAMIALVMAFVKKRIFDPLGMTSSVVLGDHARLLHNRATGYAPREDGGGFGPDQGSSELTGATLLYTSVADLARWDANFYAPAVGGARMLEFERDAKGRVRGFELSTDGMRFHFVRRSP